MAETTPKKISDLDALTTPQDTDVMPVVDNSGTPTTKKSTWANIKATLKTYFDTLYESLSNKKTTLADDSDTYYPSQKAVKTAVDAKEDAANKETSALDTSTTKYPCNNVVKTAVDAKADKGANSDITSLSGLTTALSMDQGGTGQATAQAAIDALTNVSAATNEHVLTKDTATGNAIFKAASGGANTALSNLADVAINTTLKSDTDNTDDLGASDKRWANAQIVGLSRKNLVINGCGIVNQRVSAYTLFKDEYGFGPDRWAGMATGTAVSAGTLAQTTSASCGRTGYAFKFSGVTLTGTGILYLRTRIESKDAIWLKNQVASFQAKVYHDVGSAVNYTIYVKKANAADDFSSTTAIGNSGAISVTSATATTIKYEAISMGDCSNGIEIEIKIECGEVTTKNFELTEMQMEEGSKCSEIEYKSFNAEIEDCQGFFEKSFLLGTAPGGFTRYDGNQEAFANPPGTCETNVAFKAMKIKTPTITIYDSAGNVNKCDYYNSGWSNNGTVDTKVGTRRGIIFTHAISGSTNTQFAWVADAEL